MSTLSHRHGWTLRKDDARACACQPSNPRHQYGWKCIPETDVQAWRQEHPECKGTDDKARVLMWLELNFGGKR